MTTQPKQTIREKFSWERPIEILIIEYCDYMASELEKVANHHRRSGWFANIELSNKAEGEVIAFRMVIKHIAELRRWKERVEKELGER